MPVIANFVLPKYSDGNLFINMTPPVAIGGWSIEVKLSHRFGSSSGVLIGSISSGIPNGSSGLSIVNSGEQFQVTIPTSLTSGLPFGNYVFSANRVESGFRTTLAEGFLTLEPSVY